MSLDTLLVGNPAKEFHLNDTSTGVCTVRLMLCLYCEEARGQFRGVRVQGGLKTC